MNPFLPKGSGTFSFREYRDTLNLFNKIRLKFKNMHDTLLKKMQKRGYKCNPFNVESVHGINFLFDGLHYVWKTFIMALTAASEQAIKIVRELVNNKTISRYRLAREMGLSTPKVVNDWIAGLYFDCERLPRLMQVKAKWEAIRRIEGQFS